MNNIEKRTNASKQTNKQTSKQPTKQPTNPTHPMSETDHIHILGTPFHYENIDLTTPNGMQGGTYFTKLMYNQMPLYVQTPKCETRQGIVLNGKKAHYDIIVAATDTDAVESGQGQGQEEQSGFVEWLERVEDRVVQLLHEKGRLWFTNELSVEDIKTLLTPPVKAYRGGKQLLVRVNVSSSKTNSSQFGCKIFDEQENPATIEYIKPEHSVISIVEIAGVRFTSRSFQIELVSKQMAVLANTPLFETCLIKKDRPTQTPSSVAATSPVSVPVAAAEAVAVAEVSKKGDDELAEIHLDVFAAHAAHAAADSISIKNPLEVYYTMYRAAKKRAIEAKKIALEAYLDAKNIKNIYNLNLADDDDDEDSDSAPNDDDDDDNYDDNDEDNDDDDDDDDADDDDDGVHDDADADDVDTDSHKVKKKPITILDSAIVLTMDELI